MSKRFGVDALLPIGLILWTLSPMILLVMGGLFQTVPAPDKVTNEPVDSSNTLGSQAPALFMISLPSGFILLSFYWACRRGDQKRKRLRGSPPFVLDQMDSQPLASGAETVSGA